MSIVVLGSSNTDMILRVPRLPKPGETVLGGEFQSAAGGKGANQAVAAARAGGDVSLIARVGRDALGDQAIAGYARDGIAVEHVARDDHAPTGVALICVEPSGENAIAVASGANARLSIDDVESAPATIAGASILLMQLETPLETVEAAAQIAHAAGVPVILNPAPACGLPDSLLARVSILTPNQSEAEALTGQDVRSPQQAEEAAKRLMDRGAASVIVTMSGEGALWRSRDDTLSVAAHAVDVLDTTGAGDVFNGCLAVALAEARDPTDALAFANAAAALSVTREGAQPSAPTRKEIEIMEMQQR